MKNDVWFVLHSEKYGTVGQLYVSRNSAQMAKVRVEAIEPIKYSVKKVKLVEIK